MLLSPDPSPRHSLLSDFTVKRSSAVRSWQISLQATKNLILSRKVYWAQGPDTAAFPPAHTLSSTSVSTHLPCPHRNVRSFLHFLHNLVMSPRPRLCSVGMEGRSPERSSFLGRILLPGWERTGERKVPPSSARCCHICRTVASMDGQIWGQSQCAENSREKSLDPWWPSEGTEPTLCPSCLWPSHKRGF
jgi:hypothetical protein